VYVPGLWVNVRICALKSGAFHSPDFFAHALSGISAFSLGLKCQAKGREREERVSERRERSGEGENGGAGKRRRSLIGS
jgi:hypothetical protein